MAMLLAMFQKMKLVREKNMLTLEQTQYSSKLSRIQKNIENKQKYYAGLLTDIKNQAKNMLNQYTYMMQSSCSSIFGNLNGCAGSMYGGAYGMYGANSYLGTLQALKQGGFTDIPDSMVEAWCSGAASSCGDGSYEYGPENNRLKISADQAARIRTAQTMFQQAQQSQQMYVQGMIQQATNFNSIWVEQQEAAIEAEQDEVLGELSYQETMLQLEKDQRDIRLQRITAELDTYTQLVSQEAKNSAPTFGLG